MPEPPIAVTKTQKGRPAARPPRTLRELRVERGLTLAALSATTGIAVPTLSQIERGRRVADPDEIRSIETALGLDLHLAVMVVHWKPAT